MGNVNTEKLKDAKEAINTFYDLHEWLSVRRVTTEFIDWCDTIKDVKFSLMIVYRSAKQPADQPLTRRQQLCLDLGREFVEMKMGLQRQSVSNFS